MAEHCCGRVAAICAYVRATQLPPALYRLLAGAIVVEYARPFCAGSRSQIGDLESKYAKFSNAELTSLHGKIVKARHDAYAHFSPERQGVYFKVVSDAGGFSFYTALHHDDLNPVYVPMIEQMCAELSARLTIDGRALITELVRNEKLVPGEYRLSLEDEKVLSPIPPGEFTWPEDFDRLRIPPDFGGEK